MLSALGFIDPIANATTKTLAQMRDAVRKHLGVVDPLPDPPKKPLAELVEIALTQIGLADPMEVITTRSLSQLRSDMMTRMGFGGQVANPPPGVKEMLDGFINESQQTLWRRLELDKGDAASPPRMTTDTDETTLDYVPVLNLALALAKSHYGQPDARAYFEISEKYLLDVSGRRPPNIEARARVELIEAQQTVYRRYELGKQGEFSLAPFSADTDETTIDYKPVLLLAVARLKQFFKQEDAKTAFEEYERYMADVMRRSPPGVDAKIDAMLRDAQESVARRYERGDTTIDLRPLDDDDDESTLDYVPIQLEALVELSSQLKVGDPKLYLARLDRYFQDMDRRMPASATRVVTRLLIDAQEALYRRYNVLRTERTYRWPLQAGVSHYALGSNADECPRKLDPRKVSWVGVQRDESWLPLTCGIPPEFYSNDQTGWPARYEIRQCIEVWPVPDEDAGYLRIKGHFGLEPFAEDEDRTTIDDQPVFLLALANAKEHFRQPDGQNYVAQLETLIAGLVAGSHHTRRYVPGSGRPSAGTYAIPRPSEPFN